MKAVKVRQPRDIWTADVVEARAGTFADPRRRHIRNGAACWYEHGLSVIHLLALKFQGCYCRAPEIIALTLVNDVSSILISSVRLGRVLHLWPN